MDGWKIEQKHRLLPIYIMPKNCQIESQNSSILFLLARRPLSRFYILYVNKRQLFHLIFLSISQEAQQQVGTTGQGKPQNCSVRQTNMLSLTLALTGLEGFLCNPLTWTLEQCSRSNNTVERKRLGLGAANAWYISLNSNLCHLYCDFCCFQI